MRLNRISLLTVVGVLALTALACTGDAEPTNTPARSAPTNTPIGASEPLSVVASIYPMQYFAERIGGDRVEVVSLVPPGAEGHTFELTAGDLLTIGEADVIAMNGLELEPWLERALESLGSDVSAIVVEAADAEAAVPFEDAHDEEGEEGHEEEGEEEGEEGHEEEGEEEGEEGHEDAHGEFDPHFWLDPLRAITQAERIAEALIGADPEGEETYRANLATLSSELRALHTEFEAGLSSCVHHEFVTSHAAYGYLALAYDLEQVSVSGLSPDAEPSPQRLASIGDRISDLGLGAILVEPVLAGAHEQVLSAETGASIYPIHPMDGITQAELDQHGDYFGLMRDNLQSLRAALECS